MIYTDKVLGKLPRKYISEKLDITQWDEVKSELEKIAAITPTSAEELLTVMEHASELSKALTDELSWRYIRMTVNADNTELAEAYNDYNANVFAPC